MKSVVAQTCLDLQVNFPLNVTGPASSIAANATNRRSRKQQLIKLFMDSVDQSILFPTPPPLQKTVVFF